MRSAAARRPPVRGLYVSRSGSLLRTAPYEISPRGARRCRPPLRVPSLNASEAAARWAQGHRMPSPLSAGAPPRDNRRFRIDKRDSCFGVVKSRTRVCIGMDRRCVPHTDPRAALPSPICCVSVAFYRVSIAYPPRFHSVSRTDCIIWTFPLHS
ncbi:hypothetical protein RR46_04399 [Papilio xuthus]|uniref:Uncharacterized protein n=1 Tax=Papilio xuthus TaxID=66420 RepID=A0A194PLL9_PAPXU|nr:hypothetical protein RR46_04399 [Papilio xuthus]